MTKPLRYRRKTLLKTQRKGPPSVASGLAEMTLGTESVLPKVRRNPYQNPYQNPKDMLHRSRKTI